MKKTITFEIGTEELPAKELHLVSKQILNFLSNQSGKMFNYDNVDVYTTPRRILIVISGACDVIDASIEIYKGPILSSAYIDGKPTKAVIGFAKGKGVDLKDLEVRDFKGKKYVYVTKKIPEVNVIDILPNLFHNLINSIKWIQTQRWGSTVEQFGRPIRWIFAMFGKDVIDFEYAGLKASNISRGHRLLSKGDIQVDSAEKLVSALQDAYVVLSEEKREQIIKNQIKDIESKLSLTAKCPISTLAEVVNLCEYPTCLVGKFEKSFLQVPKEIIVDAMLMHQRYFPLYDSDNNLTNNFIIVSNGNPKYNDIIIDGHQRVVAARLFDAKFFYEEDKKHPLDYYVSKLHDLVFQEKLGDMELKAKRISKISKKIAEYKNFSEDDISKCSRAALLAKADLVTNTVIEFTKVQGIMGYYYALSSGESMDVAQAIRQHYNPKFAGDVLPDSNISKSVALADKIDTLCGMFAINETPTGSSDPYALRRSTIGIINIMIDNFQFDFPQLVKFSLDLYQKEGIDFDLEHTFKDVLLFVNTRAKVILKEFNVDHDCISAIDFRKVKDPLIFMNHAKSLYRARCKHPEVFDDLACAFTRANNLREPNLGTNYDMSILNNEEKSLVNAISKAQNNVTSFLEQERFDDALVCASELREPIDCFFNNVMVMSEDKKVRDNRLKILNAFVDVFTDIADFSKMQRNK